MKLFYYIVGTAAAVYGIDWFISNLRRETFGVFMSRETGNKIQSAWRQVFLWPGYLGIKDEIGIMKSVLATLVYGVAPRFVFGRKK